MSQAYREVRQSNTYQHYKQYSSTHTDIHLLLMVAVQVLFWVKRWMANDKIVPQSPNNKSNTNQPWMIVWARRGSVCPPLLSRHPPAVLHQQLIMTQFWPFTLSNAATPSWQMVGEDSFGQNLQAFTSQQQQKQQLRTVVWCRIGDMRVCINNITLCAPCLALITLNDGLWRKWGCRVCLIFRSSWIYMGTFRKFQLSQS